MLNFIRFQRRQEPGDRCVCAKLVLLCSDNLRMTPRPRDASRTQYSGNTLITLNFATYSNTARLHRQ